MSITNWKQWLLENERAVRALALDTDRKVGHVALVYRIKPEELQEFLDHYNGGEREITTGKIDLVKRELGLITETKPAAPGTEPAEVEDDPQPADDPDPEAPAPVKTRKARKPRAAAEPEVVDSADPWLSRRRPKANVIEKYRERLEALAAGEPRADREGTWRACLRKWFGDSNPPAATVRRFLDWYDQDTPLRPAGRPGFVPGSSSKTRPKKVNGKKHPKAKKHRVVKIKPAKKRGKYKRRVPLLGAAGPNDLFVKLPEATPEIPNTEAPVAFCIRLFGYEITIRRAIA